MSSPEFAPTIDQPTDPSIELVTIIIRDSEEPPNIVVRDDARSGIFPQAEYQPDRRRSPEVLAVALAQSITRSRHISIDFGGRNWYQMTPLHKDAELSPGYVWIPKPDDLGILYHTPRRRRDNLL